MKKKQTFLFMLAYFLSSCASYIFDIGVLVYLYNETESLAIVGTFFTLQLIPALLILIFGRTIDLYSRKRLIAFVNLFKALTLSLAIFYHGLIIIFLVNFLFNTFLEFERNIFYAFIPETFEQKDLIKISSAINIIDSVCMLLAPIMATTLAKNFSLAANIYINMTLCFLAFISYLSLKYSNNHANFNHEDRSNKPKIKIYDSEVIKNIKHILLVVISWMLFMLCIGVTTPMEIVMIQKELGMSSTYYGIGNTFEGIGMMISSYIIYKFSDRLKTNTTLIIKVGLLTSALSYLIIGFSGNIYVYLIGAILVGITSCLVPMGFKTTIQMVIKNEIMGRVFAATRFLVLISRIIGTTLIGVILNIYSIRAIYICISIVSIGIFLLGCLKLRDLEL